jgi:hypothetical protein
MNLPHSSFSLEERRGGDRPPPERPGLRGAASLAFAQVGSAFDEAAKNAAFKRSIRRLLRNPPGITALRAR